MDKEKLFEEAKYFVESKLETADLFGNSRKEVMQSRGLAFGVIQFLIGLDIIPYEEIKSYWEYAYNKFEKIANEKESS